MPRHRLPLGDEQPTEYVEAVRDFVVLTTPLGPIVRVVAAGALIEGTRDGDVSPRCHPPQAFRFGETVTHPRPIVVDPPGYLDLFAIEQRRDRGGLCDRGGVDGGRRHMFAEADHDSIASCRVPAHVCLEPLRFGQHVAVEEDDDVSGRVGRTGSTRCAQPLAVLGIDAHHLDLERCVQRWPNRWLRAVVDDGDRGRCRGVGLMRERSQHRVDPGPRVPARDHDVGGEADVGAGEVVRRRTVRPIVGGPVAHSSSMTPQTAGRPDHSRSTLRSKCPAAGTQVWPRSWRTSAKPKPCVR